MEKCNGKEPYYTQAEADAALASIVADAKKTGHGGTSWRRLNVYSCGHHFHVGRNNNMKFKSLPAKKIPSYGELLRRKKRIDERLLNELKHKAYVQGQIIDADARAEKAKAQRDYEAAVVAITGELPK